MSKMSAILTIFVTLFLGFGAHADNTSSSMSEADVRWFLRSRGIEKSEQDKIVEALKTGLGQDKLVLEGNLLFTHGWNGSFFVDNDMWAYDLVFKSPDSNKVVEIKDFLNAYLYQGGTKISFGYEWHFIFLPHEFSVRDLNGSVWGGGEVFYGRGIGINAEAGLGIQLSWLNSANLPGHMFMVFPKLTIGEGIGPVFPKIIFGTKEVN